MAKTAYSLILSDDVVAAVDLAAAQQGLSRSALINHILAEYVSLSTPEMRSRDILSVVEEMMGSLGLRPSFSPGGALTLRTALRYKYNPQLSYVMDLQDKGDTMGELRVTVRSQNKALLTYMQLFFQLWDALEQRNLPTPPPEAYHQAEPRRYVRRLRRPDGLHLGQTGEELAAYVKLMDKSLNTYFTHIEDPEAAVEATERAYRKGLAALGEAVHF